MQVSVIIPVYNVEAYLRACLDSIVSQSFTDWEAILVDDGSHDSSPDIAREYSACDSRFRTVIMPVNSGPSEARNAALREAKGDYIIFVDSDDIIPPEYISLLLSPMREADVDITSCGFRNFSGKIPVAHEKVKFNILPAREALEQILYQRTGMNCSVGCKAFRRKLFNGLEFRSGTIYEDLDITRHLFLRARKVAHTDSKLYFYRTTPGSITHTFGPQRLDVLDVTERMERALLNESRALHAAARSRTLSAAFNMLMLMRRYHFKDSESYNRCRRMVIERRKEIMTNPKVRFKNRLASLASFIFGLRMFR